MKRGLWFALVFGALGSFPALAYENDVHYGLTKWLALKAGFTSRDAELVAVGDRDLDGGALDAVRLVLYSACIGKDDQGAREVQRHHFPSPALIPSEPNAREVVSRSPSAYSVSDDRIVTPKTYAPQQNLLEFGNGIHSLQDSFSHRGVPDVPGFLLFTCDSGHAFGHPSDRGGWTSHDPDLTSVEPGVAMDMAKATWDQLCRYKKEVMKESCNTDWNSIAKAVGVFAQAKTKAQKRLWFRSDEALRGAFESCDFLNEINLPDGKSSWCETEVAAKAASPAALRLGADAFSFVAAQAKDDPKEVVEKTLKTWFVDRDVVALTKYLVDPAAYRAANNMPDYSVDKRDGLVATQFSLWLYRDHGSVHKSLNLKAGELANHPAVRLNMLGLGDKETRLPAGTELVRYGSLADALFEIGPGQALYDVRIVPCKDGGRAQCAIAAARLKKAPYENLLIEYRKIKGLWRLTKTWSLVDR